MVNKSHSLKYNTGLCYVDINNLRKINDALEEFPSYDL